MSESIWIFQEPAPRPHTVIMPISQVRKLRPRRANDSPKALQWVIYYSWILDPSCVTFVRGLNSLQTFIRAVSLILQNSSRKKAGYAIPMLQPRKWTLGVWKDIQGQLAWVEWGCDPVSLLVALGPSALSLSSAGGSSEPFQPAHQILCIGKAPLLTIKQCSFHFSFIMVRI